MSKPVMISDCMDCGILGLDGEPFLVDTLSLFFPVLVGVICFTLWRIFVTNRSGPRGGIVVLGLDDSSSIYSDYSDLGSPISVYVRISYCVVAVVTFLVGVAISEALKLL